MSLPNMIVSHFDDQERHAIVALLEQLRQMLQPKLIRLTPEERQRFGSIGEENKKLVNKVRDLIDEDPSGLPEGFDLAEFQSDFKDRRVLEIVRSMMDTLLFEVESTKILHDYDNYQAALAYYNYQNYRMSIRAPLAEGRVEQMKGFFNRTRRPEAENSTPEQEEPK